MRLNDTGRGDSLSLKEKNKNVKQGANLALDVAFAEVCKKYGKGAVMTLGERSCVEVDTISTGSIFLDGALGVGGLPRGRVVEVFGAEASGKTTIALQVVAQSQQRGGVCAFIDAEHALDPIYAGKLGVKAEDLVLAQPDSGEQALEIAEMLIRSGAIDVLVIDSVAALVPRAELEGDMGDPHMGLQARLMSQALRKLTPVVNKSKTVLIFINQVRHKINAMPFANKETTTGGLALKFYASVRLEVKRIGSVKRGDVVIGNKLVIKVVKNKVAPPFTQAEVELIFGQGISKEKEVLDVGLTKGVFRQAGAWYYYNNEKFAQGREDCLQKIKEDSSIREAVLEAVEKEGITIKDIGRNPQGNDE